MTLEPFYGDWRLYNDLVIDALGRMSTDDLALRAPSTGSTSSASWPIWAIAGHTAGMRVYWLSDVMGLPGSELTPFHATGGIGWEDDPAHPRSAQELLMAWTTTWGVVERALETWSPPMLDETIATGRGKTVVHFTRRSLVLRLITHEAYHVGQIAVIQAIHGRPQIDLWPRNYHTVEAAIDRSGR
jgi:uncharacterized damage-inducible protein DinB